jgi:pimeloyl-ACP methyl ester carboxylesterase
MQLTDGRSLGYAEYGDPSGRPVLFFHGTPSSRLIRPDETITARLGARLITMDRPGFGLSDFQPGRTLLDWPDDVLGVAAHLGIDRFSVVGVSGGGPYVAACAYKIPDRLHAAAILSSAGPIDEPGALAGMPPIRQLAARIGCHAPWLLHPLMWLAYNPRRNPERFFARYTAHNPPADRVLLDQPWFRTMLTSSYAESTRRGLRGFAWEIRLMSRPWGFRLADICMVVDLWHGDEDTSTSPAMAKHLARAIPRCRARFLPGEGHFLLFTHWAEILSELLR